MYSSIFPSPLRSAPPRPAPPLQEMLKHPTEADFMVNGYFFKPKNDRDLKNLKSVCGRNKENTGSLLAGFFKYYGFDFDFRRHVVTLSPNMVEKDLMGEVHCWPSMLGLAIQDPFEVFYNVGHVVKLQYFHVIRREFARAYTIITQGGGLDVICEEKQT